MILENCSLEILSLSEPSAGEFREKIVIKYTVAYYAPILVMGPLSLHHYMQSNTVAIHIKSCSNDGIF